MIRSDDRSLPPEFGVVIWIAIVSGSSVLFSSALACATPFAALATVSALALRRRQAFVMMAVAWLLNQVVGFGLLHYPLTPDAFGWGFAIGLAALGATAAVKALAGRIASPIIATTAGFALAFATYEGVLFAATAVLPSGDGAFSPAIVGRILCVNLLALVGLALLHRAALALRLLGAGDGLRLAKA